MRTPPKIPLVYRLAALTVALMIGLYVVQIYLAGVKFAGVVASLSRMAPPAEAQSRPSPAEPGVVPVRIIAEDRKKN